MLFVSEHGRRWILVIFGTLVVKGFSTYQDAEERSQISVWWSLVCLLAYSDSFTCDILMCLVNGRFGNKRSALHFHRSFDGPKHSLDAITFFSFSSLWFQLEIKKCCDHLFVCHYWSDVCLEELLRLNLFFLYWRSVEQVFQSSRCSCNGCCTWIRGSWVGTGGREGWEWEWVHWKIVFMKVIIEEAGFNQRSNYKGIRVSCGGRVWVMFNGKVREARLLATFLYKGCSQCGPGCSLDAIQFNAHHGMRSAWKGQKKLIILSCATYSIHST